MRGLFFGFLGVFIVACNPLHTAKRPDEIRIETGQTVWQTNGGETAPADRWWTAFGDGELDQAVRALHGQNLDLAAAMTRLAQAKAAADLVGAFQWPSLDASGSAARARGYDFMGQENTSNQFNGAVAAGYEVDAWGKISATVKAAAYDHQASRFDVESLGTTLTAQLVDLWVSLIELRASKALVERQIATNETQLELVKLRYAHGLTAATAVLQQERQVHATKGLLPGVVARMETAEHQLAILLGKPPRDGRALAGSQTVLPEPHPLPALGVPADLLVKRPDLRAEQVRVAAADERIGAALAEHLPSFRLQASVGAGAQSFGDLLDRWIWSLTSSIVLPLIDGGRRGADVDRARAAAEGLLVNYKATFLRALGEVEDALTLERTETEKFGHLTRELAVSKTLLDETRTRYLEGLSDYLPVLNAIQAHQRAERSWLTAARTRLSHRVRLYRALGGIGFADLRAGEGK